MHPKQRRTNIFPLKPSPKIFKGYKCAKPSETIAYIKSAFLRLGIKPHYLGRRFSFGNITLHSGRLEIPETPLGCNGKGVTKLLSEASAYAELTERFSSILLGDYIDTRRSDVLFSDFLNYSFLEGCVNKPALRPPKAISMNSLIGHRIKLTSKLRRDLEHNFMMKTWVNAINLADGDTKKVPIKFISEISSSNGIAAGNTYEEAIAQAICEIIERYVQAEWICSKRHFPSVNIPSITDDRIKKYLHMLGRLGLKVIIKDLSMGKGYPAVGLAIKDRKLEKDPNPFVRNNTTRIKCGCSTTIEDALCRCFTEIMQGYTFELFINTERKTHDRFWKAWNGNAGKTLKWNSLHRNILKNDSLPPGTTADRLWADSDIIEFGQLPSYPAHDARDDVVNLLQLIRVDGHEAYAIDFTHPVLDFPVVQIIVPGLSDLLRCESPLWLGMNGFVPYALSSEHNLLPFIVDDEWIRKPDDIKRLLDLLQERFTVAGWQDTIISGCKNISLFKLGYRLSLANKDYRRALIYCRTLKNLGCNDDISTSSAMEHYLRHRGEGESHKDALCKACTGRGFNRISSSQLNRCLKSAFFSANPMIVDSSHTKTAKRLPSWIQSFYRK